MKRNGQIKKCRIKELYLFEGLGKSKVEEVVGDLCYCWIGRFEIGDTVADLELPEALPSIKIDEPTVNEPL